MKRFVAIALMSATTTFGGTSTPLESWQASPREAARVPADQFKDYWIRAGQAFGYPTTKPGGPDTITLVWADAKWLDAQFDAWNGYDNRLKLYLAGFLIRGFHEKLKDDPDPETFKSEAIGLYQCMNTVAGILGPFKKAGGPAEGTVEETLKLCAGGRI